MAREIAVYKGDDIRDRKLAEAASAVTVSSGDSVVISTSSDEYAEVDRNSFAGVMRETMGPSIKTNDKGTNISSVVVTATNGNDLGSITTDNLKSVIGLGANIVRISQTDYDNLNPKDPNTLYFITES